jgi:hypothetical protein
MKEIEKYKSIIIEHEIILWDSEPTSYRFKAKISFINGSNLIVRDYLYPTGRKYSFHWQDKNGNLIARWDNAAHWREIDTFPHHKHDKKGVFPSKEVSIEDILRHVYEILKK